MNPSTLKISDDQYTTLAQLLDNSRNFKDLCKMIVNAPFADRLLVTSIDLGIVVLLMVNNKNKTLDRIALSDNDLAQGAIRVSAKPFNEIQIPLSCPNNIIVKALKSNDYQLTDDWNGLFTPELKPEQARKNQVAASIECSMVWPLGIHFGGALIFSFYQPISSINGEHIKFGKKYSDIVDQALKRSLVPPKLPA